jgi:RNase P subunit RPR2
MVELVIGIVGGALFSWLITYLFYKKSSVQIPEWAKPIIERLPEEPPTKEKLLELFQDALDKGEVEIDPVIGYVACPKCKASSKDLKKTAFQDDLHTVVVVECPHCGWNKKTEI